MEKVKITAAELKAILQEKGDLFLLSKETYSKKFYNGLVPTSATEGIRLQQLDRYTVTITYSVGKETVPYPEQVQMMQIAQDLIFEAGYTVRYTTFLPKFHILTVTKTNLANSL